MSSSSTAAWGSRSAAPLIEAGWVVHFITDFYGDDAAEVPDERWIADGCRRGWALLTKDKKIRYRSHELSALRSGHLFCVADGNLGFQEMGERLRDAAPAMERATERETVGFWHVLAHGRIELRWP